ncbi:hypothetical protein GOODEAATRI_023133 [Goodea atripinnis]|uniref:Uncharacterized protein n=1 Tax=Goodea atripinnis TaxID=208336 RepID=A0ABV0PR16_9TELE
MVTPLTENYFNFGELGNSLMYSLCGVEVIVGFFFVRWLSSKVADRVVLAVGLVICCTACICQGVRRSVGGLATILGPLWAGGLTNNLYIMLGMMLALLVMITVSGTGAFPCLSNMFRGPCTDKA